MPHKRQYELEHDPMPPSKTSKHVNGTHLWVKVKKSTIAVYGPGKSLGVHISGHNPCKAQWKCESKYSVYGPPVHMQLITCMGPTAAPLLPLTAAPIAEPSSTTTAVAACTPTAGAASIGDALRNATTHHAAIAEVRKKVLALAREIRRPQAWIGYIAFILFGLLNKCRPQGWEGAHRFCFIEHFAPWAVEICIKECAYAAIPCALRPTPSCVVQCVQIGDDMPLSKMSHYVAGIDIPSAPTAAVAEATVDESAFATFHRTLGVHHLLTICDGDCGLDVMCLILGVERSLHERMWLC